MWTTDLQQNSIINKWVCLFYVYVCVCVCFMCVCVCVCVCLVVCVCIWSYIVVDSPHITNLLCQGVCSVEVALLALYNMEVLDEQGQPRIAPFRLPTLARHSVFHEVSHSCYWLFNNEEKVLQNTNWQAKI